jgi:hypothetical protein
MPDQGNAIEELAALEVGRAEAATHLDSVEAGARQAQAAVQERAQELAELERTGATSQRRTAAEAALRKAREAADHQLWVARIESARQAIRAADVEIRQFTAENLDALLAGLEQERGLAATERINRGAAEVVAGFREWQAVATEIGQVLGRVARPGPGDVSRSLSDEAARACQALLGQGGEQAPRLDRTNPPWDALLGGGEAEDEVAAEFTGTGDDEPAPADVVVA